MRKKPYGREKLRKQKCVRCGEPACHQWEVHSCRAGVNWGYLPLCDPCDETLNNMVLTFFPEQVRA